MARGRASLAGSAVYVPIGWRHDEQEMSAGRISAGNARKLAQAISAGDSASARAELQRSLFAAESQGHGSVLLTSEWLLPALAHPRRLTDFSPCWRRPG